MSDEMIDKTDKSLQRLAKWRGHFAGWQLGTRVKGDPESDAVRDHREVTILMRCELNTLVGLLLDAGVFTSEQWTERLGEEAEYLMSRYEQRWPGARSTLDGMQYDTAEARHWMTRW